MKAMVATEGTLVGQVEMQRHGAFCYASVQRDEVLLPRTACTHLSYAAVQAVKGLNLEPARLTLACGGTQRQAGG